MFFNFGYNREDKRKGMDEIDCYDATAFLSCFRFRILTTDRGTVPEETKKKFLDHVIYQLTRFHLE